MLSFAMLLGGCGGSTAHGTSLPMADRGAAGTGPPCTTTPRNVCVTSASGGRTVVLSVGSTLHLELDARHKSWSAPALLGTTVLRQASPITRRSGTIDVAYKALAPGRTQLRATARPICLPAHACPQFIVLWELHVRVTGH
jgi:hypothetical protein